MPDFKEFFKDLKDRLSSPLFSAFIISWLIINWRIPIGLIFSSADQLAVHYKSPIDLIEALNVSLLDIFWYPLMWSVAYVIGFPWIKAGIQFYNVLVVKIKDKGIKRITKGATVPIEQFWEREEEIKNKLNEASEYYAQSRNELKSQIEKLEKEKKAQVTQYEEVKRHLENKTEELEDIQYYSDFSRISGRWNYVSEEGTTKESYSINIGGETLSSDNLIPEFQPFKILQCCWINNENRLLLILSDENKNLNIQKLQASKDFKSLTEFSLINPARRISYKRPERDYTQRLNNHQDSADSLNGMSSLAN